jgi:HK97 family phage major capsid protein
MGTPDMLLSKPVNVSEYAPNTFTTGLYVGLYGDLKYYWICDALTMEIQALMELYARTNQIDYITRIETDGAPVLSAAFARITLA